MNQPDHFSSYLRCYVSAADVQSLTKHTHEFEASAKPSETRPFEVLLPVSQYYIDGIHPRSAQ